MTVPRRATPGFWTRRRLLGTATMLAATAATSPFLLAGRSRAAEDSGLSAEEALQLLKDGNARFVGSSVTHLHQSAARRTEVAAGQHPFAIVIGCSDSRVPPEVVFDQGLGDLFTIRVAGNVIDDAVIGSVEFAAEEFGVQLVVVMGHERCGAVVATVDAVTKGTAVPGHIGALVDPIRPAVTSVQASPGDLVDNAVRAHARLGADLLRHSEPLLYELVEHHKLTVVAARYDLSTGRVDFLD